MPHLRLVFSVFLSLSLVNCASSGPIEIPRDIDPPPIELPRLDPNDMLSVSVDLDQTVVTDDDTNAVALIEVTATDTPVGERPPVSMALVLDTSGSMEGDKIENARLAADEFIERLAVGDVLTVVTYSDTARAHLSNFAIGEDRSQAHSAIEQIVADGNTCTSCGLEMAFSILASSPQAHLRRVVLMSDGHANRGTLGEVNLQWMAQSALDNYRIHTSTVGLGRLHNELVLAAIAEGGTADYYFLHNSQFLAQILDHELAQLHNTVVTDLLVRVTPGDGVSFNATNHPSAYQDGYDIVYNLGQLSLGERRQLFVEVALPPGDMGRVLRARAQFADLNGATYELVTDARISRSNEAQEAEASINQHVVEEYALVTTIPLIQQAITYYESGDIEGAYDILNDSAHHLDQFGSPQLDREAQELRELVEVLQASEATPESPEARGNIMLQRARANELLNGVPSDDAYHSVEMYDLSETE